MQMWWFSPWCLIDKIPQRFSPRAQAHTQLPSLVLLKPYKYKYYKNGQEKTLPSYFLSALPQICHHHSPYLPGSLLPVKCSFCHLGFRFKKKKTGQIRFSSNMTTVSCVFTEMNSHSS